MSKDKEKKELSIDEFIPMYIEQMAQREFDDFKLRYTGKEEFEGVTDKQKAIELEISHIDSILNDKDYLPISSNDFTKDATPPRSFLRKGLAFLEQGIFIKQGDSKLIGNTLYKQPDKNLVAIFHERINLKGEPITPHIDKEHLYKGYKGVIVPLMPRVFLRYKEKLENLVSREKQIAFHKELFGDALTIMPESSKEAAPVIYDMALERANKEFEDWLKGRRQSFEISSIEKLRYKYDEIEKYHLSMKHPLLDLRELDEDKVCNLVAQLLFDAKEGKGKEKYTHGYFVEHLSTQMLTIQKMDYLYELLKEKKDTTKASVKKTSEPDPPPSFDELTPMITNVLKDLDLLTEIGTFKGKAGNIKVLVDALRSKGYIDGLDTKVQVAFAEYFKDIFQGSVTDRTLRNPLTEKQKEMLPDYKAAIPKK
jgi:hypothetical protein